MNSYTVIDIENWNRKMHCAAFRNSAKPTVGFTVELDVTKFQDKVRKAGLSFTIAMIYATCKISNEIEEFRYRFLGDKVVLFDKLDVTFPYMNKETELFKVVSVPFQSGMVEFCKDTYQIANEQEEYFPKEFRQDVIQCSPIPFMTYTAISHTSSGKKDNATPTFDWGKYYEKDGKIKMPFSLSVHHSFVDGIHIGQFVDRLQEFLDS